MPPSQCTSPPIDLIQGNEAAFESLMPVIYDELRRLAHRYLRNELKGHSLQTTALVHEAYLKLAGQVDVHWQGRAHFFRAAAQAMRRILVDHARSRQAVKRDAGERVTLTEGLGVAANPNPDVLGLHHALDALSRLDQRKAAIVELRYFAGLSVESTAEVLWISPATVKREWALAKGWLYSELSEE